MVIQQLHLNKKIFFTASDNEVQKEIFIKDEVVVSKIACGNLPFNDDVRDWWKAVSYTHLTLPTICSV